MTDQPSQASHPTNPDAAFESLYMRHHRQVLAYCAKRTSRPDAWDATAEVFVVAWRRLDEVPPRDEALAWLLGVAYRVLANQRRTTLRGRRLNERVALADWAGVPRPDELLIRSEESRQVIEALARLRPPDREILQLTLWEDLSPVEIAEVLGISRAAVDQRYYRAKRRLGVELKRRYGLKRRLSPATPEKGGAS
jgi:RNA polymerase sigma-70 factor, ECF subfamily